MLGFDAVGILPVGGVPSPTSAVVASLSTVCGVRTYLKCAPSMSSSLRMTTSARSTIRQVPTLRNQMSARASANSYLRSSSGQSVSISARSQARSAIKQQPYLLGSATSKIGAQSKVRDQWFGISVSASVVGAQAKLKLPGGVAIKTIIKGQVEANVSPGNLLQAKMESATFIAPDLHIQGIVFGQRRALLLNSTSPATATYWKGS